MTKHQKKYYMFKKVNEAVELIEFFMEKKKRAQIEYVKDGQRCAVGGFFSKLKNDTVVIDGRNLIELNSIATIKAPGDYRFI